MSKLLFKLRNVPDDEAIEVRALLDEHGVEYFETSAGNWGISMPGLWLATADDFERARALIDDYQITRAQRERQRYHALRASGEAPTFWQLLRRKPVLVGIQVVALVLLIVLAVRLFPGL